MNLKTKILCFRNLLQSCSFQLIVTLKTLRWLIRIQEALAKMLTGVLNKINKSHSAGISLNRDVV